jgi:Toprim domain
MSITDLRPLSFDDIERLVGNGIGEFRTVCPMCAPSRSTPKKSRLRVLKIWRDRSDYATFSCSHCSMGGYVFRDGATRINARELDKLRAKAQARHRNDTEHRVRRSLEIFREARPIPGTLAEHYLSKRGIDIEALPSDASDALRWHPACPWEDSRHPCMVALYSDTSTGEPRAIHRTAINPLAEKVDRMALGPIGGCVIRLCPEESVTQGLVIGEGIETVLGAATRIEHRGTLLQPAWACGDAGNLRAFPILAGIEALTILVDQDTSGTGQRAAEECTRRWTAAGREVIRLVPRVTGSDFNDIVRRAS